MWFKKFTLVNTFFFVFWGKKHDGVITGFTEKCLSTCCPLCTYWCVSDWWQFVSSVIEGFTKVLPLTPLTQLTPTAAAKTTGVTRKLRAARCSCLHCKSVDVCLNVWVKKKSRAHWKNEVKKLSHLSISHPKNFIITATDFGYFALNSAVTQVYACIFGEPLLKMLLCKW